MSTAKFLIHSDPGRTHDEPDLWAQLPVGIFRSSPDGKLIFANNSWLSMAGASRESALSSSWFQHIHPSDTEAVSSHWSLVVSRGEPFDLEFRFLSPTNVRTWVHCCAQPEFDTQGSCTGYLGSLSDITELKESQNQLLTILDNLSDVVVVIGHDGRILNINPASHGVFGYQPYELIGEYCTILIEPGDRSLFQQRLLSVMAKEQDQAGQGSAAGQASNIQASNMQASDRQASDLQAMVLKGVEKSGGLVEVEISANYCVLAGNKPGYICVIRDVGDRTREENYRRESLKMSALTQVTRGVSHEFSNLLSVMMGNLELLATQLDDDRIERFIEPSIQAGERGADLVQRLLAFNSQQPLSDLNISVARFTKDLAGLVSDNIQLEINVEAESMGLSIRVDPVYLNTCIQQLLLNASESNFNSPEPLIILNISSLHLTHLGEIDGHLPDKPSSVEQGQYVRISVCDRGTGMHDDTLSRCVDPFFSTKEEHTGLGLSSVIGFVRQSGGYVSIESTAQSVEGLESSGTRVHLYLPAAI